MAKLILARHGLSEANLKGIIAGRLDTPLTEEGFEQARRTAGLLSNIPIHIAYSSTSQRARNTKETIILALGLSPTSTEHVEVLERNWGTLEGKYSDNRNNDFTEEESIMWRTWGDKPPLGESHAEVYARMVYFFKVYILPKLNYGFNVLLVGHNGSLKALQCYLEDKPLGEMHTFELKNAEAKVYKISGGETRSVELRSIHI